MNLYGQVSGQTWITGNTLNLAGNFQTVNANAHTLNVMNGATVTGDLKARVTADPSIAQNATVSGQRQIEKIATPSASLNDKTLGKAAGGWLAWTILSGLMALVGGAILLALFPAVSLKVARQIYETPLASLGWGFVYILLMPIFSLMLMITVLGLPLGVILLLVYVITLLLGGWLAAYAIGSKIYNPGPLPTYIQQLGQFLIGLVVLRTLELIPVLGTVIKIIVLLISLGGMVLVLKEVMSSGAVTVTEAPMPVIVPQQKLGRQSHSKRGRKAKKSA
jgi:hypothetical protein